ncbi:SDR family oxidoreductase [Mycobacterium sp.]|uniref:SDR family oxidoreductase n=1 Tax=Mycobacterium sp. TaxID=1785 RepID=UPI002B268326|nr:SDR family oxidoreductase [Mycobacterium sp.]
MITGASSGLGAEMARQFAVRGYDLGLCARRTERLAVLADEIHSSTGRLVQTSSLDVTDAEAVNTVFHRFAESFGSIDRVVVNAGISKGTAIGTGNAQANYDIIHTNVLGALAQCEAALEIFRKQGHGQLVLISSMIALRGFRDFRAVYAASKAAVASLGEGLRSERIPGVDVTVIYPGLIRSEISAHMEGNKMMVDTADGVRNIVAAIEKRRAKAYVPTWPYALVALILRFAPLSVVRRLL